MITRFCMKEERIKNKLERLVNDNTFEEAGE